MKRILILLIALIPTLCFSQGKYDDNIRYGKKENRTIAFRAMGVPNDTIAIADLPDSVKRFPHIAIKYPAGVKTIYLWDTVLYKWDAYAVGGSSSNTDSLFGELDNFLATNRAVNMNGKSFRWTDAADFSNYFEYQIEDGGYLEYQIENPVTSLSTFTSAQPGYSTFSSSNSVGNGFLSSRAYATGEHEQLIGNDRSVGGQWVDFLQAHYNDGTNAGSYWYQHREKWTGVADFTSTIIGLDYMGAWMRTKRTVGSGHFGYVGLLVDSNSNVRFENYPSTRNNGLTLKALHIKNSAGDVDYSYLDTTFYATKTYAASVGGGGFNISNANLTSTASHTYDFNSFTQTYTGGTELHDSLSFTNTVIYPTPDSMFALGDSYTNPGFNTTNSDSIYVYRYKNLLGLTLDNQGASGRGAFQASANSNLNLNPGHRKMTTYLAGLNDIRKFADVRTYNKGINAIKNIFINHYLESYQPAATGTGITRYGTWNTSYPASTVGGKSVSTGAWTQTLNDSIVYSFTGSNVVFTIFFGDGTTEVYTNSFEIYLDDVLQGTYSAKYGTDAISDGSDGNTRQPGGFIYTGLTYGAHKIKVINKENSRYLIFDYFGHLVDLNHAYPFVIFHVPKLDAIGYATSPANGSTVITDAMNTKIDSLVATFPAGYPVYVAPTNSFYTNTTASGDLDASDHIHPTDQGHRHIYDAAVSVYSSFPTISGLPQRIFWSGDRPYVFDDNGQLRALVYFDESANVAGSNKQVQYNNNGSMGGATGFEVGNTNNRVKIESQATTEIPLITKGFGGQTAPHYQAQSSTGTPLYFVDAGGGMQILGLLTAPVGSGGIEMEYSSGSAYITSYNRGGSSWQPINLRGSTTTIKSSNVDKLTVSGSRISLLDSVYLTDAIPYNSSAGIVHLGIDTVIGSPTFGKLVRKTAGGSTPTLQQVTDVGSTTTNTITVDNGNFDAINGTSFRVKDDNGAVAAVLWYQANDYGLLRMKTGASGTMNIFPQSSTSNNNLYLPKTGNANDTTATLFDIRQRIKSKGVTLESPTSSENFGLWQTQVDITVSSINAVVIGSSPSVTINIAFGSNITSLTNVFSSGTAITNTTTGQTINSGFNDATIPAGSWIRLTSSAQSGTVTQIEVTINYTED